MAFKTLAKLKEIKKDFYTIADLEKIFGLGRDSLLVALSRLEKRGQIIRLSKGIYQLPESGPSLEKIATEFYQPSYISFETALAKYGILSQIPYAITLATTNRPKKQVLQDRALEYRQLKKELFFGFLLEGGIYFATPEKALLDELYLVSKGLAALDFSELDLGEIDKKKFFQLAEKFPPVVRRMARKLEFS